MNTAHEARIAACLSACESKPKYRIEQSGDCVAVVCGDRSFAGTKLEMAQHLGQAWEEVRRLQAVVDKLPKTADGVSVVPGMQVWIPDDDHAYHRTVDASFFIRGIPSWPVGGSYSTREAVEAAKEATT